ncbi:hypothetical protein J4E83_008740 [Alternaria metachromatica]|uniref:uncharacterized protein n=1 Tax=Alternaria metachromatica TaxID=283354 RepID=UPI0020C22AF3|nr:uncharacterized protein J4E83_008740 [Alternaria metachromatica]KAI4609570.1 hypothetical protein J4E83_008740 [Alternaria metachromatica]
MASDSSNRDTSDFDDEFGAVELAPSHMSDIEVFCRLLGHSTATVRQMKKNFFPKSRTSGTPELWDNRRGVDVVLTDSKGAEWGVHKSVICTGSRPVGDYLYNTDRNNFVYTEDGKIRLVVEGFEPFAIDAFVQSDYFGSYVLSKAMALSRARKVPGTPLAIVGGEIAPGLQLLHHLEVLRLGDRLQHAVGTEALGYIQLLLGRKTIGLVDWLTFMRAVFHGQIGDTTLGQRLRMVVAAYAAYHDSIWLGHEEYRKLFRGAHSDFAGLCTEVRHAQAGLVIDSAASYVTASQHMGRMAISSLSGEISLEFAISAHAHSAAVSSALSIEHAAPPQAPPQVQPPVQSQVQQAQPPVQPSTRSRDDRLRVPLIQSMLDEQKGIKGPHAR